MALVIAIADNLGLEAWRFSVPLVLSPMSIYPQGGIKTLLGEFIHLCTFYC
jgi:hypothetical protein